MEYIVYIFKVCSNMVGFEIIRPQRYQSCLRDWNVFKEVNRNYNYVILSRWFPTSLLNLCCQAIRNKHKATNRHYSLWSFVVFALIKLFVDRFLKGDLDL